MADSPPRAARPPRIPLNTLAIGFGLTGFAGTWSAAARALGLSHAADQWAWILAAAVWLLLLGAHALRGLRSSASLSSQLRQPVQGPIAALVPTVTMLLGADLFTFLPSLGWALVVASIATAALYAGWLLALWVGHGLPPESLNGAFFLPTVAAALIASTTASKVGLGGIAMASFGIGLLFWFVILALLIGRLAFLPTLPDPLVPTLAILLAPPAVAGIAWFQMTGRSVNAVSAALLGITVLMLLMQLFLVPKYVRLKFSLGFWSFTFPFAAAGTFGIDWLALTTPAGWQIETVAILAVVTALVLAVAGKSLLLIFAKPGAEASAETQLSAADERQSEPRAAL